MTQLEVLHHPYKSEFSFDPSRIYFQQLDMKPRGFWVSLEDDWMRFCRENEWPWPDNGIVEMTLETERCLWLKTAEDLDEFTLKYGIDYRHSLIDWNKVVYQYAGIIISPYQWSRRMKLNWYYPGTQLRRASGIYRFFQ